MSAIDDLMNQNGVGGGGGSAVDKLLGGVGKAVGKTLSPIGEALQAPQQGLFHLIQAGKDIYHGNAGGALGEVGNVGKAALAGVGVVPGASPIIKGALHTAGVNTEAPNINFTQTIGAKKLFPGLETLGSAVTDPWTYATLGLGPEARAGLEGIKLMEGGDVLANTVRQGGWKGLDEATQNAVKEHLTGLASEAKNPEKVAMQQIKGMASRAPGGLGIHIPGTDIGTHIAGSFDRPELASKFGEKFPKIASMFSPEAEAKQIAAENARVATEKVAAKRAPYTATNLVERAKGAVQQLGPTGLTDIPKKELKLSAKEVAQEAPKIEPHVPYKGVPTGPKVTSGPLKYGGETMNARLAREAEERAAAAAKVTGPARFDPASLVERAKGTASTGLQDIPNPNRPFQPTVNMIDKLAAGKAAEEGAALKATKELPVEKITSGIQKFNNMVRNQMLAFPGTVANRERRGVTMNFLDKIGPIQQIKEAIGHFRLQKLGKAAEEGLNLDPVALDHSINDAVVASQKAVAKGEKIGQNGMSLHPPVELSYKEGLAKVLRDKGITMDQYKGALTKQGLDPEHYINYRQIMATSGHNLYETGKAAGEPVLNEGGGKISEAAKKVSEVGNKYYTTPIRKAGTAVENMNRGVSALTNLERYGNPEQAAKHVRDIVGDPWTLTGTERKIRPFSPFIGSIRSHVQGVARAGFDNPAGVSAANHTLGGTLFGQGSGAPVQSATGVMDIPALLGQGHLSEGLQGANNLLGGPIVSTIRAMANAHALSGDPKKDTIKVAKQMFPAFNRLPIGQRDNLVQQISRFVTGVKAG
jgi:hypothetical protein